MTKPAWAPVAAGAPTKDQLKEAGGWIDQANAWARTHRVGDPVPQIGNWNINMPTTGLNTLYATAPAASASYNMADLSLK